MKMLLAFQKAESLRHLGHLDLLRSMQRALRRSNLPVRYSQGFNPHMLTSFASALSMGVSSAEEIVEVGLAESVEPDAALARMNRVLPEGLRASRAVMVEDAHPAPMGLLKQASYTAWLQGVEASALADTVRAFLAEQEVMALRVSKRGEKLVNIRPMVHALSVEGEIGGTRLEMRLSLEEAATLKPELLLSTLWERAGLPSEALPTMRLKRLRLFGVVEGEAVPLLTI